MYAPEELLPVLQTSSGQTSPDLTPAGTPNLAGSHAPKFGTRIPNRIFVGGIAANTNESELKQFFSTYGAVKDSKIISDRAGVSKGYGFITFETQEDADKILKKDQDFASKVYEAPAFGSNGALFYANGVPYTYQNGMAFFQSTDGTASYQAVSAQPQAQPYQMVMQGGQPAMYVSQTGYSYPTAAAQAAANSQWRWGWSNQVASGQPAVPGAATPYMQYVPTMQTELMYAQNAQAFAATDMPAAENAIMEAGAHAEGSMHPALEQQQPNMPQTPSAVQPHCVEGYPQAAAPPTVAPPQQYGAVYVSQNPAASQCVATSLDPQQQPQHAAAMIVPQQPNYPPPPPSQQQVPVQAAVSSPGMTSGAHLPASSLPFTQAACSIPAQPIPSSILVSQAQQQQPSLPVNSPPQMAQNNGVVVSATAPGGAVSSPSQQPLVSSPSSTAAVAMPSFHNVVTLSANALSPMAQYASAPPAKRAMVHNTPRKSLANMAPYSPRGTPPPTVIMNMKMATGQPQHLTPPTPPVAAAGQYGQPAAMFGAAQTRMLKVPQPCTMIPKPGEMGDTSSLQMINNQLTPPPTPKVNPALS